VKRSYQCDPPTHACSTGKPSGTGFYQNTFGSPGTSLPPKDIVPDGKAPLRKAWFFAPPYELMAVPPTDIPVPSVSHRRQTTAVDGWKENRPGEARTKQHEHVLFPFGHYALVPIYWDEIVLLHPSPSGAVGSSLGAIVTKFNSVDRVDRRGVHCRRAVKDLVFVSLFGSGAVERSVGNGIVDEVQTMVSRKGLGQGVHL
jgi:hypothetical protein